VPLPILEDQDERCSLGQEAQLGKLVSCQPAASVLDEVCFGGAGADCEGLLV
jgi:hypothetical protein